MSSGCRRLRYPSRRLACDEQHGALRPLGQFRRNLAKEQLVAGSRIYAHHQKIVVTHLEMMEDGVLWRPDATHRALDLDTIMFPQSNNLADDGVRTGRRCECSAEAVLP
jgi:hypothetical protein